MILLIKKLVSLVFGLQAYQPPGFPMQFGIIVQRHSPSWLAAKLPGRWQYGKNFPCRPQSRRCWSCQGCFHFHFSAIDSLNLASTQILGPFVLVRLLRRSGECVS